MEEAIEVLAPAGDYDTLKAAICAGADAVYVGGERFGARAYAKNFNKEELLRAIDYVHLHGRKLYLTVNTLVKEREFGELYEYLLPFYMQGLDAVIVQDLGVMDYILRQFPELSVHASTQMTVTNAISAKYLEKLGVERVVPARELSLEEIRKIRRETGMEIECFVHGALCYCYSGQCLLSSMIGGRSGNRGQCAQPCRLPYKVEDGPARDILSLKDLCTIQYIPKLIESGITSFKIEGRMKQPAYVAAVTSMYRKYTDLYLRCGKEKFHVSERDHRELERAYQRRGYCDGYYFRHNGKEMLSLERPENKICKEWIPDTKCQKKINGKLILSPGERVTLYLDCHGIELELSGEMAEAAVKQPATSERIEKQMRKTGNTPFVFEHLEICIEGDIFVPIQSVNELRRKGLKMLEERLSERFRRQEPEQIPPPETISCSQARGTEKYFSVSVESMEQLRAVVNHPQVSRIYVEDALWAACGNREELKRLVPGARSCGKQIYFAMARIFRKEAESFYGRHLDELVKYFDGALARNLESCIYLKKNAGAFPVVADSNVYQWNRYSKRWWSQTGIKASTAPVELNRWELAELGIQDMEMIVYGYLPVMVSAGCVRANTTGCDRCSGFLSMKDRHQNKTIVKNECIYCYNVTYNKAPLMLLDQCEAVRFLEPEILRLQFTVENERETREVLDLYSAVYAEGRDVSMPNIEFTRGHFKRGVK